MSKLCLGCMELYDGQYDICPHCGYMEGTKVEESIHMEPGTLLDDRYIIGRVLGYGGFGVTYIAWDKKLEQKVAIKEYLPSEFSTRMPGQTMVTVFGGDRKEQFQEGLEKFVEEAKRLSKFQNETGIVKIFDSFKVNDTAYIIMEYLNGETLADYLEREGKISEDKAIAMLLPILNSLQLVHKDGILHRDIAPENIFITKDGDVKLIDFGASRYATTSHSRSLTVIIKPGYSPEEQYRSRGDQGPHTDIYALAATMYKMVTGITPPDALERRALIETKKKDLLKDIHKVNKGISRNIENAILNAMNVQIEDRTSDIESFVGELNSETPVKRRYGKIKKIDVYGWPLWLKITAPSVFAALAVTGVLLITGIIDFPSLFSDKVVVPEGMVVVPNVEGMDKDVALEEITKLGLKPSPEGNVDSAYIEAGKIVLQTPQGGSYLNKDGKVALTVSSGTRVVGPINGISTVPYVVWDTEANAIAKLQKAGLIVQIQTAYDNNVAAGKVISQSIEANEKIKQGSEITIVVSSGKKGTQSHSVQQPSDESGNNYNSPKKGSKKIVRTEKADFGESGYQMIDYNEAGQFVSCTSYNKQGQRYQYNQTIFDKNGNMIGEYRDSYEPGTDKITSKSEVYFAPNTGEIIHDITEIYDFGGEYFKEERHWDTNGNCLSSSRYDKNNTLIEKNTYEYQSKDVISYWVKECYNADGTLKSKEYPTPNATKEVTYEYNVLSDKTLEIIGIYTKKTSLTIPATIDGYKVSSFHLNHHGTDAQKIQSITIPNSVVALSDWAFAYCTSLTSVTIPNSVTEVGEYAFRGCTSLKSITLPNGVTKIDEASFMDCISLTSITIPKNVVSIGTYAFSGCKSLKTITIPENVNSIGQGVFSNCTSLVSVTISKGVPVIGEWMFSECTSLTTVTIPDSVISIEIGAFINCKALKSIRIPRSIKKLRSNLFNGVALTDVWYGGSEEDYQYIEKLYPNDELYNATWHYNS